MNNDLVDDHRAFARVNNAHLIAGTLLKMSPATILNRRYLVWGWKNEARFQITCDDEQRGVNGRFLQ
jgi:hypothetical protein